MKLNKKRNSSIELLKCLAIIMIVISHSMPVEGQSPMINLANATNDIQLFIAVLFRSMGQIGNDIFIICSAWFLIENERVNYRKVAYIISDVFFISIAWLCVVMIIGYNITMTDIVKQFLPITFENNWFIGCYILLYIIHPLLNKIINTISKERYLLINTALVILYCIIGVIKGGLYYYTKLVGFIVLYFLTGYMKKHLVNTSGSLKSNIVLLVTGATGWIGLQALTNLLGLHIGAFSDKGMHWITMMNPFMIMIAFALFNIVRKRQFTNGVINYLSSLSLLIYVIHEDYFMKYYIRNDLFGEINRMYSLDNLVLWILGLAFISLIVSILAAGIYTATIKKILVRISGRIVAVIQKMYKYVSGILLKYD